MPAVVTRTPMKLSSTTVARTGYLDAVYGTETPSPVRKLHADFLTEETEETPCAGAQKRHIEHDTGVERGAESATQRAHGGETHGGETHGGHSEGTPHTQKVVKRWAIREGPAIKSPKVGVLQVGEEIHVAERLIDASGRSWIRCEAGWATTHDSRGQPVLADAKLPPASPDLLSAYLRPTNSPVVAKGPQASREPLSDRPLNGHAERDTQRDAHAPIERETDRQTDRQTDREPEVPDCGAGNAASKVDGGSKGAHQQPQATAATETEPEPEPEPSDTSHVSMTAAVTAQVQPPRTSTAVEDLPTDLAGVIVREIGRKETDSGADAVGDFLSALGLPADPRESERGGGAAPVQVFGGAVDLRASPAVVGTFKSSRGRSRRAGERSARSREREGSQRECAPSGTAGQESSDDDCDSDSGDGSNNESDIAPSDSAESEAERAYNGIRRNRGSQQQRKRWGSAHTATSYYGKEGKDQKKEGYLDYRQKEQAAQATLAKARERGMPAAAGTVLGQGIGGGSRAYSSSWDREHSLQIKLRECMADREEMRQALEESQREVSALSIKLKKAASSSKKQNSSAWKLRQEVDQLKVDVAKKAQALETEFKAHAQYRELVEDTLQQQAAAEAKYRSELVSAQGEAMAAAAVAQNEKAAARRFVEQVASEMERTVMKDLADLRDVVSDEMRSASLRIGRVSEASGRLKTELINAQRAAMVAGMEAAQATADAERAEEQRKEAVHRAKIATDRLAHSGSPAGGSFAAAAAATGSPPTVAGGGSPPASATAQRPQHEHEQRLRELERALQAAISGRRAAEEEAVEATSRTAKSEAR